MNRTSPVDLTSKPVTARELVTLAKQAGAHDAACVPLDAQDLQSEGRHAKTALPEAKSLVSIVLSMNREPLRTPARSIANLEFHHAADDINAICRRLVRLLQERGHKALNPSMGFPMEADAFPGRMWTIAHKTVAVAAGMGHMGIHRSVIHPRFGSMILLGTVICDVDVEAEPEALGAPLKGNPCLECKLCVPACPVGAISPAGELNFTACLTHNYREFLGGFADWAEGIADAKSGRDLRKKTTVAEQVSMWQSLSFGANYKGAYCLAVCPAGDDVIGAYLEDKRGWRDRYVKPLQEQKETLYVLPGSDAEAHAQKRSPHKTLRRVSSHIFPTSIPGFLRGLKLAFQPGQAKDLNARYHFNFTDCDVPEDEPRAKSTVRVTIEIRQGTLAIHHGLQDKPDLAVTADAATWLAFLAGERGIVRALLTRKIKPKGKLTLLVAFGRCFPL